MTRRAPMNCQNEPHYPGVPTVTFSIRYPDLTCHHTTALCPIEPPHRIAECGEWGPSAETPEAMHREIANEPRLRRRPTPPGGRNASDEQRTFDVITMRYEGLSYAEIGRRVGLCGQRIQDLCHRATSLPCNCVFCCPPVD